MQERYYFLRKLFKYLRKLLKWNYYKFLISIIGYPMFTDLWKTDLMATHLYIFFCLILSGITRNEMLAAITSRLHAEAMASLPPNVRRRVRALRSLQKEFVDIEAKFYSEVHALECKYEKLYKPLFEKVKFYLLKIKNCCILSARLFVSVIRSNTLSMSN